MDLNGPGRVYSPNINGLLSWDQVAGLQAEKEGEGMGGAVVALAVVGGLITVSLASSAAIKLLQAASDAKQRKVGRSCLICKGIGFYECKLCRCNSTIHWSPLSDPIAFNPCVCPTCDGHKVQRCLNCIGKGYW